MIRSKDILKRIKKVESAINASQCPELIMISYNENEQKYIVNEIYINEKCKEVKRANLEFMCLSKYVFSSDFMGVCILDLVNAPIAYPNLYVLNAEEIRKELKIDRGVGFRIEIDEKQIRDGVVVIEV